MLFLIGKSKILIRNSLFLVAEQGTMIVRKEGNDELILIGQTDHSRLVGQLAALDDAIRQMVIVRIGGELEVGQRRAQVQHGGKLDTQFTA